MRTSLETALGTGVGDFSEKKEGRVLSRKDNTKRICARIWALGQKESDKEKWRLMRWVIHRM